MIFRSGGRVYESHEFVSAIFRSEGEINIWSFTVQQSDIRTGGRVIFEQNSSNANELQIMRMNISNAN